MLTSKNEVLNLTILFYYDKLKMYYFILFIFQFEKEKIIITNIFYNRGLFEVNNN